MLCIPRQLYIPLTTYRCIAVPTLNGDSTLPVGIARRVVSNQFLVLELRSDRQGHVRAGPGRGECEPTARHLVCRYGDRFRGGLRLWLLAVVKDGDHAEDGDQDYARPEADRACIPAAGDRRRR